MDVAFGIGIVAVAAVIAVVLMIMQRGSSATEEPVASDEEWFHSIK